MKISTLKKKVWKTFSEYIRQRDADWRGYVKCITCPKVKQWKEMDAGHYISRSWNSVLFNEKNVHAQCKGCNSYRSGRHDEYALALITRYGKGILEELNKFKIPHNFTIKELEELHKEIKVKLKQL